MTPGEECVEVCKFVCEHISGHNTIVNKLLNHCANQAMQRLACDFIEMLGVPVRPKGIWQ